MGGVELGQAIIRRQETEKRRDTAWVRTLSINDHSFRLQAALAPITAAFICAVALNASSSFSVPLLWRREGDRGEGFELLSTSSSSNEIPPGRAPSRTGETFWLFGLRDGEGRLDTLLARSLSPPGLEGETAPAVRLVKLLFARSLSRLAVHIRIASSHRPRASRHFNLPVMAPVSSASSSRRLSYLRW